jgi:hypothetical protein
MKVSLLKQIIKEELENVLENESSNWDTLYNWLNIYTRNDDKAKSFLYKHNIINGTWLKKALDSGEVTIDQIDNLAKNPEGQSLSDLSMYKKLMGMNEESATGAIGVGAGPIQTPYAFAPKGQKKNKATKYAEKMGFKTVKGMPKNSKMLDYKELWKGKKSAMNEQNIKYQESANNILSAIKPIFEEAKIVYSGKNKNLARVQIPVDYADGSGFMTLICGETTSGDKPYFVLEIDNLGREEGYTYFNNIESLIEYIKSSKITGEEPFDYPLEEVLNNLIKEELLNEVSYNKFKNEVKYRTKAEMLHKSIREVKRKLSEVDQLIEYTTRIKQELSENEDGTNYWKRSLKAINEISEISNKISNKIKSIYQ